MAFGEILNSKHISKSGVLVSHTGKQQGKGQERKVSGGNEFKLDHRYWESKRKGALVRGNICPLSS